MAYRIDELEASYRANITKSLKLSDEMGPQKIENCVDILPSVEDRRKFRDVWALYFTTNEEARRALLNYNNMMSDGVDPNSSVAIQQYKLFLTAHGNTCYRAFEVGSEWRYLVNKYPGVWNGRELTDKWWLVEDVMNNIRRRQP